MPLPLLALAGIAGGASAFGKMFEGYGNKKATDERNKAIRDVISKNDRTFLDEKNKLTNDQRSLSTDFLTAYITSRDNDRASGLRSEYGRNQTEFSTTLARMLSEKNALNANLTAQIEGTQSDAAIIGGGLMSGAGSGLAAYAGGLNYNNSLPATNAVKNNTTTDIIKQIDENKKNPFRDIIDTYYYKEGDGV